MSVPSSVAAAAAAASGASGQPESDSGSSKRHKAHDASDVQAAMTLLRSMLPASLGYGRLLPPLLLQHQLYWLIDDRTLVDRTVV